MLEINLLIGNGYVWHLSRSPNFLHISINKYVYACRWKLRHGFNIDFGNLVRFSQFENLGVTSKYIFNIYKA